MSAQRRKILAVTGTRAEYGLLQSVFNAIDDHENLDFQLLMTGTHLLGKHPTSAEVLADWPSAHTVEMQQSTRGDRAADAAALGRGIQGCAEVFAREQPDVVLVLGDRIEALSAAAAASVAGIRVAHLHGGDRAEGVADDSLRHAISKLSHIHFPASAGSAERLRRLGERDETIHITGSPALDGLGGMCALDDASYARMGSPRILMLFHPVGRPDAVEESDARRLIELCCAHGVPVAGMPNHDPGRDGIVRALEGSGVRLLPHLERAQFVGLIRRVDVILGNSSAGLIEASALGTWCVNVGSRQAGRDCPAHVISVPELDGVDGALARCLAAPDDAPVDAAMYGSGDAGTRIASLLAELDFEQHPIRKQIAY